MTISWRRFKFFQDGETRVVDFPAAPLCCTASATELFFGCEGGQMLILDQTLATTFAFVAYAHSVLQIHLLKAQNILVTLGTEEPGVSSSTLKLWSIDRLFSDGEQQPQPLRSQKLFTSRFPESDITTMALTQRLNGHAVLAVGLASGMVYWTQGDLLKDRFVLQKLSAQLPGSSDKFCVKGLGFYGKSIHDACECALHRDPTMQNRKRIFIFSL